MVLFGATGGGPLGTGDRRSRLFWALPGLGRTIFPPLVELLPGVFRLLLLLLLPPPPAAESVGEIIIKTYILIIPNLSYSKIGLVKTFTE